MSKINLFENRIVSVDAFRGLIIFFMLLVNNPGNWQAKYVPLSHSEWHGINFADYIFPFFIFIVGISIVLAAQKYSNATRPERYKKIIKRTILLYLLGMVISLLLAPAWGGIRFVGILQKIAIVYFFSSIIQMHFSWKGQLIILLFLLLAYWFILAFVPVPGLGTPSYDPVNNLPGWLDRLILPGILYDGDFDSEGIMSTLSSISTGLFGLLAGKILIAKTSKIEKASYLFLGGFFAFILGEMFGWVMPINKNLWTSSFAVHTAGAASMSLASLMIIIDVRGYRKLITPLIVLGSNSIIIFLASFIFLYPFYIPFFGPKTELINISHKVLINVGFSPEFASLLWAIAYAILCFLIPGYLLYKRKIFLKV